MDTMEAFFCPIHDIPILWTRSAQKQAIFIAQRQCNQAASALRITVSVKFVNDILLYLILISWVDNAVRITALDIEINVAGTRRNCYRLFPIDFIGDIALSIPF